MDKLSQVRGVLIGIKNIAMQGIYAETFKGMEAQCVSTYRKCIATLKTVPDYEEVEGLAPELTDNATMQEIGFAVETVLSLISEGVRVSVGHHGPGIPPVPPIPPMPQIMRGMMRGVRGMRRGMRHMRHLHGGPAHSERMGELQDEMREKMEEEQEHFEENIEELEEKMEELQEKIEEMREKLEERLEEIQEKYEEKIEEIEEEAEEEEDEEEDEPKA